MMNRVPMMEDGQEGTLDIVGVYVLDEDIYLLTFFNSTGPRAYKVLPKGLLRDKNADEAITYLHNNEAAIMQSRMAVKRPIDLHFHIDKETEVDRIREILNAIK
jgi:hypothetical protein